MHIWVGQGESSQWVIDVFIGSSEDVCLFITTVWVYGIISLSSRLLSVKYVFFII